MTMLDDARAGMDNGVRPQDDLFGHVNGRWLGDRGDPLRPVRVGRGSTWSWRPRTWSAHPRGGRRRRPATGAPASRSVTCSPASSTRPDRGPRRRAAGGRPGRDRRGGRARRARRLRRPLRARAACGGLVGAYVDTDDRNSDRYIVNMVQGGLGLPDESYYREDEFAEIRAAYVAHVADARPGRLPRPAAASRRPRGGRSRPAWPQGHWDARHPRRPQGLQPDDLRRARGAGAGLRLGAATSPRWARTEETLAEVVVRQPSYLGPVGARSTRCRSRTGRLAGVHCVARPRRTSPRAFVEENFDFYGRTLTGTPELRDRWKRGVAFVEGPRRGRRQAVRRAALPARGQGADGRAGGQPGRGVPAEHRPARLDERGDPGAGARQAGQVPAEDRLPEQVPRLLALGDRGRRPARQRAPRPSAFETDRQLGQDRRARRPRRVAHDAADGQRLLQPRHQRDLLPGGASCSRRSSTPTPTPRSTTAASAR